MGFGKDLGKMTGEIHEAITTVENFANMIDNHKKRTQELAETSIGERRTSFSEDLTDPDSFGLDFDDAAIERLSNIEVAALRARFTGIPFVAVDLLTSVEAELARELADTAFDLEARFGFDLQTSLDLAIERQDSIDRFGRNSKGFQGAVEHDIAEALEKRSYLDDPFDFGPVNSSFDGDPRTDREIAKDENERAVENEQRDALDNAHGSNAAQGEPSGHNGTNPGRGTGIDAENRPVVFDLDGDGFEFISIDSSTALFDHDSDGFLERMGWVGPDDGFLVVDLDDDGAVSQASELIIAAQTETLEDTDLEALSTIYDTNGDDQLSIADDAWNDFYIWRDTNQDGASDPGELISLSEFGMSSISLIRDTADELIEGNVIFGYADYELTDGSSGRLADAALGVSKFGYSASETDDQAKFSLEGGGSILIDEENIHSGDVTSLGVQGLVGSIHSNTYSFTGDEDYFLVGNSGDDVLSTAAGNDVLVGGLGADTILGGDGNDTIVADAEDSQIDGGNGFDTVIFEGGVGVTFALDIAGVEQVMGTSSDDYLTYNGTVDVTIFGGGGLDTLSGGEGNDLLVGEGGADTILGGSGDDVMIVDALDVVSGSIDGGAGIDQVILNGSESISIVLSQHNVEVFSSGSGNDVVSTTGSVGVRIDGGHGNDTITGGDGDDLILGGNGADHLDGGEGFDYIVYRGSSTLVNADLSTDTVSGGDADGDSVGNFEGVVGSSFGDSLKGDSDFNALFGERGDDLLEGGAGDGDFLDGGLGTDTSSYEGSSTAVTVDLSKFEGGASGGDAEGDRLFSIENLIGSDHADTLTGSDEDNVIEGGDGGDNLVGGEGNDTVSYASSDASVTVNLSSDTTSGGDAAGDTITGFENVIGSDHNDALTGDAEVNTLTGGLGNDTLSGNAGDDVLIGEEGADNLSGGDGNDTLRGGAGADVIDGGAGTDTVGFSGADAGVTLTLSGSTIATISGGSGADTVVNVENVIGSDHADTITGDTGANVIEGGHQQWGAVGDTLDGGAGTDTLSYENSARGVGVDLSSGKGDEVNVNDTGFETTNKSAGTFTLSNADGAGGTNTTDANVAHGGAVGAASIVFGATQTADQWNVTSIKVHDPGAVTNTGYDAWIVMSAAHTVSSAVLPVNQHHMRLYIGDDEARRGLEVVDNTDAVTARYTFPGKADFEALWSFAYNKETGETQVFKDGERAGGFTWETGLDVMLGQLGVSGLEATLDETADLLTFLRLDGDDAVNDVFTNFENLTGSAFGDELAGDANANTITGGGGDDEIDGGAGADVAVYQGDAEGYSFTERFEEDGITHAGWEIEDISPGLEGDDGKDTLTGIEQAKFNDRTVFLDGTDNNPFAKSGKIVVQEGGSIAWGLTGWDIEDGTNLSFGIDTDGDTGTTGDQSFASTGSPVTITSSEGVDVVIDEDGGYTYDATQATAGATEDTFSFIVKDSAGKVDLKEVSVQIGTPMGEVSTDQFATLDGTFGGAEAELSSTGLTLSGTGINPHGRRTGTALVGKQYFEVTRDNGSVSPGGRAEAGIVTGDHGLTSWLQNSADAYVFYNTSGDGGMYHNGAIDHNHDMLRWGHGETLRFAFDADTGKLWVGNDTGWFGGGNPALGTGATVSGIDTAKTWYAAGTAAQSTDVLTFDFGQSGFSMDEPKDFYGVGLDASDYSISSDGTAGDDHMTGGAGDDALQGHGGNETLVGGGGNDLLDGGEGNDTVSYAGRSRGVEIDLSSGRGDVVEDTNTITPNGSADWTVDQSGFSATADDVSTGNNGGMGILNQVLEGDFSVTVKPAQASSFYASFGLFEHLAPDPGDFQADNRFYYANSSFKNGSTSEGTATWASGDTVKFEREDGVIKVYVNDEEKVTYTRETELDLKLFVAGFDNAGTFTWNDIEASVTIALETDTLVDIENAVGTSHDDTIRGTIDDNTLTGGDGDDVLEGRAGADALDGGAGSDTVSYSTATAGVTVDMTLATQDSDLDDDGTDDNGHAGGDVFTGIENLEGSTFDDTLKGDSAVNTISGGTGDDTLAGGGGNDSLDGGAGNDTLDLSGETGTLNLDLTDATHTVGADTLTLTSIEGIVAGSGADILVGDNRANSLDGGAGNDTLSGGIGFDSLTGGDGIDTATFSGSVTGYEFTEIKDDADAHVGWRVQDVFDLDGDDGTDTVEEVEHLSFSDRSIDITGTVDNDPMGRGANIVVANGSTIDWHVSGWDFEDTAANLDLSFSIPTSGQLDPALGTVTLNSDGTYNFQAASSGAGTGSFTYRVTDSQGNFEDSVVNVTVGTTYSTMTAMTNGITGASDRLEQTSVAGDKTAWTFSGWIRPGTTSFTGSRAIFGVDKAGGDAAGIAVKSGGIVQIFDYSSSAYSFNMESASAWTNTTGNEWTHIVVSYDSDSVFADDRVRLYVDGTEVTSWTTEERPDQGFETNMNASGFERAIGSLSGHTEWPGDFAEFQFVDGEALAPNSFGNLAIPPGGSTAEWMAKTYFGEYGTSGFHLDFTDENALGNDASSNTNDFAGTGITSADFVADAAKHVATGPDFTPTAGADYILGGVGNDVLQALGGDDVLIGGVGEDYLDGGHGTDTVDYSSESVAVTVDLSLGTASGGNAEGDQLVSIERVVATDNDDTLTGSSADNTFVGGQGDDTIAAGDGDDTVEFTGALADYAIEDNKDGTYTIRDMDTTTDGDDGVDLISDVETLVFNADNSTFNLDGIAPGPDVHGASLIFPAGASIEGNLHGSDPDGQNLVFKLEGSTDANHWMTLSNGGKVRLVSGGAGVASNSDGAYEFDGSAATGSATFSYRVEDSDGLSRAATVETVIDTPMIQETFTIFDTSDANASNYSIDNLGSDNSGDKPIVDPTASGSQTIRTDIAINDGDKVYYEFTPKNVSASPGGVQIIGFASTNLSSDSVWWNNLTSGHAFGLYKGEAFYGRDDNGSFWEANQLGTLAIGEPSVGMIAMERSGDTVKLWFGQDGNWVGATTQDPDPSSLAPTRTMTVPAAVPLYAAASISGTNNDAAEFNFGSGIFDHAAPFGFSHIGTESAVADQVVEGTEGHDFIHGASGDDTIEGLDGDDELSGGAGNDTLSGGGGDDVAVFSGEMADYTVVENMNGTFTVTHQPSSGTGDGVDTISGIETLRFEGGTTTETMAVAGGRPVTKDATVSVLQDSSAIPHTLYANDPNNDTLTFTLDGDTDNDGAITVNDSGSTTIGTIQLIDANGAAVASNSDGAYTFTPAASYVGSASFDYIVENSASLSSQQSVVIDVTSPFDSSGGVAIADSEGTVIGDLTAFGGLAAAFNGVTDAAASSAGIQTVGGYAGKDWGSGSSKVISGYTVSASSNAGYSDYNPLVTISLYGSNTAPTSATDGTLLDSQQIQDANGISVSETSGLDMSGTYRYHWAAISDGQGQVYIGEIDFKEAVAPTVQLTGAGGNDVLIAAGGDDTLEGNGGDDVLDGGAGSDTYKFGRHDGSDVIDTDDNDGSSLDVVEFGSDIASDQLWFYRQGNDLVGTIVGTEDRIAIDDWYVDDSHKVDEFHAGTDVLTASNVLQLVTAMAQINAPPADTDTEISQDIKDELTTLGAGVSDMWTSA